MGPRQNYRAAAPHTTMVEERVTDGRRIAELLSSEVEGRAGTLAGLSVADAEPDIEPTTDGARAYAVVRNGDGDGDGDSERVATVYVQPEGVRVEVHRGVERAVAAAVERDLRVRSRDGESVAALLFVDSGAETKRAADVLGEAARR